MKTTFILFIICSICIYSQIDTTEIEEYVISSQSPSYENSLKPDEILVVYKETLNDTLSRHINNYYIEQRGIPITNSIGLEIPDTNTIDGHLIEVIFNGEIIHDYNWENPNTNHAWKFFKKYIMDPIQYYLDTEYSGGILLRNKIKYIVLCKGIPLKINPYVEFSGNGNYTKRMVTLDGLLCFLSQPDNNFNIIDDLFATGYTSTLNPYFYADTSFTGDYKFKPNHFVRDGIQISYLVSRLDGLTYNDVIELIDRTSIIDKSGDFIFLLDAHQSPGLGVAWLRNDAQVYWFSGKWNFWLAK